MLINFIFIYLLSILLVLFLPFSIFLGGSKALPDNKHFSHADPNGGKTILFFRKALDPLMFAGNTSRVILASSKEKLLFKCLKVSLWYSPTRFNQLVTVLKGLESGSYFFTFFYYIRGTNSTVKNVRFHFPFLIPAGPWRNFGDGEQKPFFEAVPYSSQGYQKLVSVPIDTNKVFRACLELSSVHIWARINLIKVYILTGKWYHIHYNMENLVIITKVS